MEEHVDMLMGVILPYANFFIFLGPGHLFFSQTGSRSRGEETRAYEQLLNESKAARDEALARLEELKSVRQASTAKSPKSRRASQGRGRPRRRQDHRRRREFGQTPAARSPARRRSRSREGPRDPEPGDRRRRTSERDREAEVGADRRSAAIARQEPDRRTQDHSGGRLDGMARIAKRYAKALYQLVGNDLAKAKKHARRLRMASCSYSN